MPGQGELVARTLVDLSRLDPACRVEGVAWDGAVYGVAVESREAWTDATGRGTSPGSRLEGGADYRIHRWADGDVRTLEVRDEPIPASFVQPTPGGVLLVGARCSWRPEGPERNAVEYAWTGEELRRLTLGDGIADVRTTPDGSIWVSYFDEGVFGNYGWGDPGPEPIGSSGCVTFDARGVRRFEFSFEDAGSEGIDSVYALNVGGDGAWLYFYSGFPIVQVLRGRYRTWTYGVGGARGLAVRGSRALLLGESKQRSATRVVELAEDGTASVAAVGTLVGESGADLSRARAAGIGPLLYLFDGPKAWVVEDW